MDLYEGLAKDCALACHGPLYLCYSPRAGKDDLSTVFLQLPLSAVSSAVPGERVDSRTCLMDTLFVSVLSIYTIVRSTPRTMTSLQPSRNAMEVEGVLHVSRGMANSRFNTDIADTPCDRAPCESAGPDSIPGAQLTLGIGVLVCLALDAWGELDPLTNGRSTAYKGP